MIYKGSRLQKLVSEKRGFHAKLTKLLASRTNAKSYNLSLLYQDGRNVTLSTLTDLLKVTGCSIDYFVDFEPSELPNQKQPNSVSGSNNIVNSTVTSDLTLKIDHLNEVIDLKDQIIQSKDALIDELQLWKRKYDELLKLTNTTK